MRIMIVGVTKFIPPLKGWDFFLENLKFSHISILYTYNKPIVGYYIEQFEIKAIGNNPLVEDTIISLIKASNNYSWKNNVLVISNIINIPNQIINPEVYTEIFPNILKIINNIPISVNIIGDCDHWKGWYFEGKRYDDLICKQNPPDEILVDKDRFNSSMQYVLRSEKTLSKVLSLFKDSSWSYLRQLVAKNIKCDFETFSTLINDEDRDVRLNVVNNRKCPVPIREIALNDKDCFIASQAKLILDRISKKRMKKIKVKT